MTNQQPTLEQRLLHLELRLRRERLITFFALSAIVVLIITTGAVMPGQNVQIQQSDSTIVTRKLVIRDENGVDRVVIASPLTNSTDGVRMNEQTGMVINDAQGTERFGLGIDAANNLRMGFDAPPGTGDPRNRERITIATTAEGGAYLRFLNRKTQVVGRMHVDSEDNFFFEYVDWSTGKVLRRKLSFDGDEVVEWK